MRRAMLDDAGECSPGGPPPGAIARVMGPPIARVMGPPIARVMGPPFACVMGPPPVGQATAEDREVPDVTEEELLVALDTHDRLVAACAAGALPFAEFESRYDAFYVRWPLDGHESTDREREWLATHAARVEVHRRVWDDVLSRLTSRSFAELSCANQLGFIGPTEAQQRLHRIATEAGLVT